MMQTVPEHEILDRVRDHIIGVFTPDGAIQSPQQFDIRKAPGGRNHSKLIAFGLPRSDNSNLTRGRDEEILDHTVRIEIVEKCVGKNQYTAHSNLLRRKAAITDAMYDFAALEDLDIRLRTAEYPISPTREYQFGFFTYRLTAAHHVGR